MSTKVLASGIVELEGKEQYLHDLGLLADTSAFYKQANAQASVPLDTSSSLSALEESIYSPRQMESRVRRPLNLKYRGIILQAYKPLQTTSLSHVSDPSQVSSPTCHIRNRRWSRWIRTMLTNNRSSGSMIFWYRRGLEAWGKKHEKEKGMKLGYWPKFQKLHIQSLPTRGGRN